MINIKDIIKRPIITEKSGNQSAGGEGGYSFEVDIQANKGEIKTAINKIFGVTVRKIQTLIVKGKTKKMLRTRKAVRKADWKKANILLKTGQKIDIFGPSAGKGKS